MCIYNFYYDETEHSRKINNKTISSSNYYDNFITAIVGWNNELENEIIEHYTAFENKYSERKNKLGELKSTTIRQNQFQYGFASLNSNNIEFISDLLNIFDENVHFYFSVSSKIEYIILQLFSDYKNCFMFDADAMKYTITKALMEYQPKEVIDVLYESPNDFVECLKDFFDKRIEVNKKNTKLKEKEIEAFKQVLIVLDNISVIPDIEWKYWMPFDGFVKYLNEKNIDRYSLILDKEGKENQDSNTIIAAREIGIDNVTEGDSKDYVGLRIADMIAGIIAKLLKALRSATKYTTYEETTTKKLLDKNWFYINDSQLSLYKKLYKIICVWDSAWYKSYAGIYSDDLIKLIALLSYMNTFNSVDEIKKDIDMHGEYYNSFACNMLEDHFTKMKFKLSVEIIPNQHREYTLNQRGAKVYINPNRQSKLELIEGKTILEVLSVGLNSLFEPIITILENNEPKCYKMPIELCDWATAVLALANYGERVFPAKVVFTKENNQYFADIL